MKQRTVRKKEWTLPWEETVRILEKGQVGILGLHGLDGYPYSVPVSYVFADNEIVFHSPPEGYKIECVGKNPRASFTVFEVLAVKPTTTDYKSAMVFGTVKIVADQGQKTGYMQKIADKFKGSPADAIPPDLLNRMAIMVMPVEEYSGKLKQ